MQMKTGNYIEDDDTDKGCNGELYRKRETIPKTQTQTKTKTQMQTKTKTQTQTKTKTQTQTKTKTQTRTQTKDKDAGRTLNIANCADQRGGDLLLILGSLGKIYTCCKIILPG